MCKSFKVKLGQLLENIRERNILNGGKGELSREEITGLISHIFPFSLKGCKHLTSNSSSEGKIIEIPMTQKSNITERSKLGIIYPPNLLFEMCLASCVWLLWLAVFVQRLISSKGKKISELIHNLKWLMKSNWQLVLEQILFKGLIKHASYSQILGFARIRQDNTREQTIQDLK